MADPFFYFWRTWVLFVGPLIPLFWTSGDVSSGFQSQIWAALFTLISGVRVHGSRISQTEGAPTAKVGLKSYHLANFSEKLHAICTEGRRASLAHPRRSAKDYLWVQTLQRHLNTAVKVRMSLPATKLFKLHSQANICPHYRMLITYWVFTLGSDKDQGKIYFRFRSIKNEPLRSVHTERLRYGLRNVDGRSLWRSKAPPVNVTKTVA